MSWRACAACRYALRLLALGYTDQHVNADARSAARCQFRPSARRGLCRGLAAYSHMRAYEDVVGCVQPRQRGIVRVKPVYGLYAIPCRTVLAPAEVVDDVAGCPRYTPAFASCPISGFGSSGLDFRLYLLQQIGYLVYVCRLWQYGIDALLAQIAFYVLYAQI